MYSLSIYLLKDMSIAPVLLITNKAFYKHSCAGFCVVDIGFNLIG